MNTITHGLERDCVNSLGIPVDNLTRAGAIHQIIKLARHKDGKARLVSTLNVDFLVNALGTGFKRARHPELLEILRQSDLVTADGFPILWLSRLAGRPLPHRVCGSDLVPELAKRAAREGLSLFLLGGGGEAGKQAALKLQERTPGLRIAGTAAPMIHDAGPALADSADEDTALVNSINESGADILLLGLGNPKQELWFNRNRHRLTVPVSIGVGGTFEFIVGQVRRAPRWMRRFNLEWVYRVTQDPGRLWRRYALGFLKLAALCIPLAMARATQSLAFLGRKNQVPQVPAWQTLWSSRDASLSIARLPSLVCAEYLERVCRLAETATDDVTLMILDCSQVRHVAFDAQHVLFTLADLQRRSRGRLLMLGMSEPLRRRLASARLLDLFQTGEGDALSSMEIGAPGEPAACRSYLFGDQALVFLAGRIDGPCLAEMGFIESLSQTVMDREVIIDFRKVTLLESSAIVTLRELFQAPQDGGGKVQISGASPNTKQMFRMARLGRPASMLDDQQLLGRIAGEEMDHD